MIWIVFENEKYFFKTWRLRCLHCRLTVEGPDGSCSCNRLVVKQGRRVSEGFDYHDVSIWMSDSGDILPQQILDHYYGLGREANEAGANTEAGASASRGTNAGGINVQNREGG